MNTQKRLFKFLFVLSLCFNLVFILSYIISGHAARKLATPSGILNQITKDLELNDNQRQAFIDITREVYLTANQLKKKHSTEIEAFWQEIIKPEPDPEIIQSGSNLYLELTHQVKEAKLKALINYLDHLSPNQKVKYVKFLRSKDKGID